ncbi:hypothetical protein L7F22_041089 [Adiantum nelumboides]|nr:hypothetical protein [Adiantum nelumboides]
MASMKGSSTLLQQRIDPLSGRSEWVIVQEEAAAEVLHHSLGHTSYLDMLNDSHRNEAFEAAINSALRSSPGLVLDIGAGTGLLSMMASRSLQKAVSASSDCSMLDKPVIACEAFLPMYLLAQKVLHRNGFTSSVKLVHKRSEELKVGTDMISPADVLVYALGDTQFPDLVHIRDRARQIRAQRMVVTGRPDQCLRCHAFGHHACACPRQPPQVRRQAQVPPPGTTIEARWQQASGRHTFRHRQQPTSVPPARRAPPTHASPAVSQVSHQSQSGGGSRARSHHPTTSQLAAAAHRPGKAPAFAMDVDP